MSIRVYWSVLENEWMRALEPQPVLKNLYEKKFHEENLLMNYHRCPFVYDSLHNVFSLHSLYEYSFKIENKGIVSSFYDQDFLNRHVLIRSIDKKMFSFTQRFIFFTEEDSLKASFPIFPYLEDNNITKRCMPFSGTFDIGKYFRNIDFSFFLKNPYEDFLIEKDEIFGYVSFDTKEKIEFVQFRPTHKINNFVNDVRNANINNNIKKFNSTDFFYKRFKLKKNVLKEIKENIVG